MVSDFVAAEFPKTPSPKPARIPPQTPPAGGKSAEAERIHFPSQMFRPAESALVFRVLRKMGSDFFKQTPLKTRFIIHWIPDFHSQTRSLIFL